MVMMIDICWIFCLLMILRIIKDDVPCVNQKRRLWMVNSTNRGLDNSCILAKIIDAKICPVCFLKHGQG